MLKKIRLKFTHWLLIGLSLTLLWACNNLGVPPQVNSLESAQRVLQENILPKIKVDQDIISDQVASNYSVDKIAEPIPNLDDFPLYGAPPTSDPNTVYLEIFSSAEKANAKKQTERWLVDVTEAFNAQKITTNSGKLIQVGLRNLPSGIAAQLLTAKVARPAGYTPATDLWLEMLKSDGISQKMITPSLIPNYVGFVVPSQIYQNLGGGKAVSFEQLLDGILGGKITIGYPNPYASSTALNLMYTLYWRGAGHHIDQQPLTVADLQSPQVSSIFDTFQKQVVATTLTSLDLRDIFLRDSQKLQAFPTEYQTYINLKKLPGLEKTEFIPFGVLHNSPLVAFPWTTSVQMEALQKFAQFAQSPPMQQLGKNQGYETTEYLKSTTLPPLPSGEVLKAAQSYWKQRKDGGKTAYMMIVIDTSGSMEGARIKAVKDGLQIATKQINRGNYVGLITFGDRPRSLVPLAPFDTLQNQKILAAIDNLTADGSTAMYDGTMVALGQLMERKKADPNGKFYLLLLSDGETNRGFTFDQIKDILKYSEVRTYPIAYGEVNQKELQAIAQLREATVQVGTPQNVQRLLKELFQTNL